MSRRIGWAIQLADLRVPLDRVIRLAGRDDQDVLEGLLQGRQRRPPAGGQRRLELLCELHLLLGRDLGEDEPGPDLFGQRLVGEVEADRGGVRLRLAALVVVHLDQHVPLAGQEVAGAFGLIPGPTPRRPDRQESPERNAVTEAADGLVTWLLVPSVQFSGSARGVDPGDDVVDDLAVARLEVHRPDPAIRRQVGLQHEDPELVGALGPQFIGFGHGQDKIGRAKRPVGGELARLRGVLRVSFRTPGVDPGSEGGDLGGREDALVEERAAEAGRGGPGGHGPLARDVGDVGRPLPGLLEAQERERRDLARTVAILTVLLENRSHFLVKGRPLTLRGGRAQQAEAHQPDQTERDADSHGASSRASDASERASPNEFDTR